jgi:hypothetical protein
MTVSSPGIIDRSQLQVSFGIWLSIALPLSDSVGGTYEHKSHRLPGRSGLDSATGLWNQFAAPLARDTFKDREDQMHSMRVHTVLSSLLLFGLLSGNVFGQERTKITKDQLDGTWAITAINVERPDGSRVEPWGSKPNGTVMFAPNGRYSLILTRAEVPKFAANDRLKGTPEENQAAVHGVHALFGSYTVSEADGSFTLKVEGSSFPNEIGSEQKRLVESLAGDELKFSIPTTSGVKPYVTLRRVTQ